MAAATKGLPVGYEFPSVTHLMTQERMQVYSDMEHSNTAGKIQLAPQNVHIDPEYARSMGWATTIADGLISTAWIEAIMRDLFGVGYFEGGKLMTKFIKPVHPGDAITIKMVLRDKVPEGSALRLVLDVRCENQRGEMVTVGTASGLVQ